MAQAKIGGEILKGHIATMVLSVIGGRSMHGYEVMKVLSAKSEGTFELGQGTIYPLLYSLEGGGLVKSAEATVDGRRRRLYSLTAAGRKRLEEKRETWRVFQAAMNRVLEPARMGVLANGQV